MTPLVIEELATLSDQLTLVAVLLYLVAMICFALDLAFDLNFTLGFQIARDRKIGADHRRSATADARCRPCIGHLRRPTRPERVEARLSSVYHRAILLRFFGEHLRTNSPAFPMRALHLARIGSSVTG